MQPPPPTPSATGSFVKTPFPHLLVYALERRLTGSFELYRGAGVVATIFMTAGCPSKVRTAEPIHYLGDILLELGMIDAAARTASLQKMQAESKLQGQALLELGAIDPGRLEAGLRAQVERKIERFFALPNETTFHYYDSFDLLSAFGGAPSPIDPLPVLWRGVREHPAWEHVDATLRRIGSALVRAAPAAQLARFAFTPAEMPAVDLLQQRAVRMADLMGIVGPNVGQLLVYLLMIMKQVDLVDPAQAQGQMRPAPAGTPPSSGQAFARVQLQKQTPRGALIVEEVHVAATANDERASNPVMQPAPMTTPGSAFAPVPMPPVVVSAPPASQPPGAGSAPPPAVGNEETPTPMDIGSLISNTISSAPPGMGSPQPSPAIPPPPGFGSVPPEEAASPSVPPGGLTAEQSILKIKIIERADQITSQDYFQMLGVDRDATTEQLQKAFFALAKVWHPDRLPPALVDVKEACSKVFTHLTEAHATLTDPTKRQDYMTLLRDGGATPDDQAKIQAILEAATEFQKAEILLKRSMSDPQAYDIVKRCVLLDGEQADYLATLAWLDAQKPEWLSREKTLEKCLVLERCIQKNSNCERAYFYRGLLYKRAGEASKAMKDFKKAAELNPRNLDAMREVRLHNMRGGASRPPSATVSPKVGTSKPPEPEKLGGFLGKLFKK